LADVFQSQIRTALHVKHCFLRVAKIYSDMQFLDFGMWSFLSQARGGAGYVLKAHVRAMSLVSKPVIAVHAERCMTKGMERMPLFYTWVLHVCNINILNIDVFFLL
jgi:hypothetical protein